MDVYPGAVDAGIGFAIGQQAVVAHGAAHALGDFRVKGGSQQILGGVAGGGAAAGEGGRDALGAVLVLGGGLAHAGHGGGGVVGLADELGHLVEGHLIHQVIPGVTLTVDLYCAIDRHTDELGQHQFPLFAHSGHGAGGVLLVQGVHLRHHIVGGRQLESRLIAGGGDVGLGEGPLPVGTGQVDDAAAVIALPAVQVGVVQLVDNLRAGSGGHCEHLIVLGRHGVLGGKLGLALHRSTFGGQDIVQGLMGTVAAGEVIVARIQDIGAHTVGVIGAHLLFGHIHGEGDGLPGGHVLLLEAHQLHCGLLDAVGLVVLGVGGLHIDLHHLAAIHVRGVGHVHSDSELVPVLGHGVVGVLKGAVAQAVAEGEGHSLVVVEITRVALTQHHVLIPGLVVAVADVDALLVSHIILVVGAFESQAFGRSIGVTGGVGVLDGGGGQIVIAVGVHQLAGGVHRAIEQVADGVDAALANLAYPEAGVHAVVGTAHVGVQEVHLHRVGHIEQDDDLLQIAALLELGQLAQQVLLLLGELENVAVAVPGAVPGKVRALAAHTGDHKDGGIAVLFDAVPLPAAVGAQRDLVGGVLGVVKNVVVQAAGRLGAAIVLARALGVEGPHGGVDGEAVVLQGLLQGLGIVGFHPAGAGAAVDKPGGVDAGQGDLRAGGQGQGIVPVQHQDGAPRYDALHDLLTLLHLLVAGEVRLKPGLAFVADGLGALRPQHHVDDALIVVGDGGSHHEQDEEQGKYDGQRGPETFALHLCLRFGCPFFLFALHCQFLLF